MNNPTHLNTNAFNPGAFQLCIDPIDYVNLSLYTVETIDLPCTA